MFKLEDVIICNDNQFAKIKIQFDYYPTKNYYLINIWQGDKVYMVEFTLIDNEEIILTTKDYGNLFLEILSIILKDLNIGKITIENNKIMDITLTKNEFEKINSQYEVYIYKQEFYTTKKVFKITQIS